MSNDYNVVYNQYYIINTITSIFQNMYGYSIFKFEYYIFYDISIYIPYTCVYIILSNI